VVKGVTIGGRETPKLERGSVESGDGRVKGELRGIMTWVITVRSITVSEGHHDEGLHDGTTSP
jgi:hypothetical protein